MRTHRTFAALTLLAAAALAAVPAAAQQGAAWPTRTVKIVVPHAPAGGTDLLARLLAERLQVALGQPFIVENKPGAGINIGTEYVARAPADGYTLLVTTNTHAMNVAFWKKLPYDPIKDFAPISLIATSPLLMVVNAEFPAKNIGEFVALAKAKPGVLAYGSTGVGTPQHLAPAMLESAAGIEMIHVPYKGAGPVVNALLGNEIATAVGAVNSLLPHVRTGKLRAIAVADATRSQLLPDVPTIAEALPLPGFSVQLWYAVLAPAGTPKPIIDRLNAEINRIVRDPALQKEKLAPLGLEGVGTTPDKLLAVMKADIPKYLKAAQDARITPE
jgi:tripartite-type tricarboxylate transporter receptor subunit TctC